MRLSTRSCMRASLQNVLPPGMSDSPGFDRDAFLADLAEATLHFLTEA